MIVAILIVVVMLSFIWWFLVGVVGKIPQGLECDAGDLLEEEKKDMGPMSKAQPGWPLCLWRLPSSGSSGSRFHWEIQEWCCRDGKMHWG